MTNDCPANVEKMKLVDSIEGEDAADTKLLKEMAIEARDFICANEWCKQIDRQYLAYGVGGVVAVFLVQITPASEDVDAYLWTVVGDLPPAYLVVEDNPTAADALDAYCSEMESWVEAVQNGESVDELIPVNVPPTREYAEQLSGRLGYLRSVILPLVQAGSGHK
jgi:hypothetical protein